MTNPGSSYELSGKTVLVTGGGSGVGLACAALFARHNCSICLVGRDERKLEAALAEVATSRATAFAGDIALSTTAQAAFEHVNTNLGTHVDVLVNSAGTIFRSNAEDTSAAEWHSIMQINVDGVFYFSREFARQKIDHGAIVNVSSTCGQVGVAGLTAYCASKGAVDQITRSMALELAERRITVNAVAPGAINSPMLFSRRTDGLSGGAVIDKNLEEIPIGSVAEPEEVARAILFLATERHVTGSILSIDGGYTSQ